MTRKSTLIFIAGAAAGFVLHFAITFSSEKGGKTSVAALPRGELIGKAPPAPDSGLRRSQRDRDDEAGILLRKFFADSPAQYDAVARERDEAVAELTKLSKELLLSYGTMDEAGATVGSLLRRLMEVEQGDGTGVDDETHRELIKDMVSLVAMSDAVQELDEDAVEASEFQASVIQQIGSLSDMSTARVRSILNQAYTDAKAAGINYASMPEENVDEWTQRRAPFYEQIYARIQDSVPPGQRETFSDFNSLNGFVNWKLVDPFDPGVFLLRSIQAANQPPEDQEYLHLPAEQSPIETTLLPGE